MRRAGAAAAGATAAWWCGPAAAPVLRPLLRAYAIPYRLPHRSGVALTFDDGPHRYGTPATLEALDRAGARATFFLVGEQVQRLPSLAAEIAAAGHEIALHGRRHTLLLRRTPSALRDDLARAHETIASATGIEPTLYRPPYGVFSAGALPLARERYVPLLWSRWGRDWEARATGATIARRATRGLEPGDVVLLHDADHYSASGSWRRTVAALPAILDAIAALGVPAVAVTQST